MSSAVINLKIHKLLLQSTVADPATSGIDYDPIPVPNTIQFPTANPCVLLNIMDDTQDEPNEVFQVVATVAQGDPATLPDPNVNVFICDDDCKYCILVLIIY